MTWQNLGHGRIECVLKIWSWLGVNQEKVYVCRERRDIVQEEKFMLRSCDKRVSNRSVFFHFEFSKLISKKFKSCEYSEKRKKKCCAQISLKSTYMLTFPSFWGFTRHFNLLKIEKLWSKEAYLTLFNQVCPHVPKLFNHETPLFPWH